LERTSRIASSGGCIVTCMSLALYLHLEERPDLTAGAMVSIWW
jgi:hypothetical protein